MLSRLKQGLLRTKDALVKKVEHAVRRAVNIDDEFFETLEETLLLSDVGMKTTQDIVESIREKYRAEKPADQDALLELIQRVIAEILIEGSEADGRAFEPGLNVIMITGVNGSGKTTSIGKLANMFRQEGRNVMMAACDTFRAAAVDQLEIWADRAGVPIVRQKTGTDPSAVMFDAVQSARSKGIDVLLADTAGRLHTQVNLMEELKKIRRVAVDKAQVESFRSWLVLDSTIGQNSLNQVKMFNEAITLDGLVITKLDGTARGGVVLSIVNEWKLPITYIGVGEKLDDIVPFDAREFASALLGENLQEYMDQAGEPPGRPASDPQT